MRDYNIKNWKGLFTKIEAQSIGPGFLSEALNWLTKGDKMELSRGYKLLGDEIAGLGENFVHKIRMTNGTEILYRVRDRKLEYYNPSTKLFEEVGSDILPADVVLSDICFSEYHPLAGDQLFINSPKGPFIKIMMANPKSYADMYDSSKNFKGRIKIDLNRMRLWARAEDKTGVYGSFIDEANYTTVTAEALGGSGKTRAGTLVFKAGGSKRTCFGVSITDSGGTGETFTDNYDGTLTSDAGGSGTINYMTGAYSVTFISTPTGTVQAEYQWEDSTNHGICDFTKSGTRVAGEGFVFRQDDGGNLQNILSFGDVDYCIHEHKTWALALTADDTNATNLIYREKVGIENWRNAWSTGEGIYYVDSQDKNDQNIRILTYSNSNDQVIPAVIGSDKLDLSQFLFDKGFVSGFGDLIIIGCRTSDNIYNDRIILFNRAWESFDLRDYWLSNVCIYGGALIGGESSSDNAVELFSGTDDDDSLVYGYLVTNLSKLDIDELKKVKKIRLQGEIGPDQTCYVYANVDRSGYVKVGEISGAGSYVDHGQKVYVGAVTIGRTEVGGGGDGLDAYNYLREISFSQDKFNEVKIKLVPVGIGYLSLSTLQFHDIKLYGQKIPVKYR